MQFKATLALCAAVLAAVTEGRIAFTTLPSSVKAGSPVKLSWEGADGTPITITLKRGPSDNLATVALITGDAMGNSYTWTPSTSLQDGSDYALQITQSSTDINYTGLFTISGGSGTSSSSSSSASASSAAAASASGAPYNSANATMTAAPSGTAPVSAGVTGGSASANTTFSSATLSASSDSASSSAAATTTRSGSGSGSSASSSSTAAPTNAAVNIASNFGLLLAGVAAVVYLG